MAHLARPKDYLLIREVAVTVKDRIRMFAVGPDDPEEKNAWIEALSEAIDENSSDRLCSSGIKR